MAKIQAYLMRVDREGSCYRGYLSEVENTLRAMQLYVSYDRLHGRIQVVRLTPEIDAIINDEGKLLKFPINRLWVDESGNVIDVIAGNIMCCRHDEGAFTSILPEDIPVIEKHLLLTVDERFVKVWH